MAQNSRILAIHAYIAFAGSEQHYICLGFALIQHILAASSILGRKGNSMYPGFWRVVPSHPHGKGQRDSLRQHLRTPCQKLVVILGWGFQEIVVVNVSQFTCEACRGVGRILHDNPGGPVAADVYKSQNENEEDWRNHGKLHHGGCATVMLAMVGHGLG